MALQATHFENCPSTVGPSQQATGGTPERHAPRVYPAARNGHRLGRHRFHAQLPRKTWQKSNGGSQASVGGRRERAARASCGKIDPATFLNGHSAHSEEESCNQKSYNDKAERSRTSVRAKDERKNGSGPSGTIAAEQGRASAQVEPGCGIDVDKLGKQATVAGTKVSQGVKSRAVDGRRLTVDPRFELGNRTRPSSRKPVNRLTLHKCRQIL